MQIFSYVFVISSLLALGAKNYSTVKIEDLSNNDVVIIEKSNDVSSIDQLKSYNPNKNIFFFDYDKKIDDQYAAVYFDKVSNSLSFLETESTNKDEITKEFFEFFNENVKNKNKNNLIKAKSSNSYFVTKDLKFTKNVKPYGRFFYDFKSSVYQFSDVASLIYVELKQQFVCGAMITLNGESGYGDYYNCGGYTHALASQNVSDVGYNKLRYGGVPIIKDAFPVSEPCSVTINSTYQTSTTTGVSAEIGLSTEKGLEIGGSASRSYTTLISYSKSYTDTEPSLSTQYGSRNNEFQWTYGYTKSETKTNYMKLGYLFELNNYQDGSYVGNVFNFLIEGRMSVCLGEAIDNDNTVSISFIKTI